MLSLLGLSKPMTLQILKFETKNKKGIEGTAVYTATNISGTVGTSTGSCVHTQQMPCHVSSQKTVEEYTTTLILHTFHGKNVVFQISQVGMHAIDQSK